MACTLALCVGCGIDFDTNKLPHEPGGRDAGPMRDGGDVGDVDLGDVDASRVDAGALDAGAVDAGAVCYLDQDGDGVGAGAPLSCSASDEAGHGASAVTGGDCDDNDAQRWPGRQDSCGDNIDNDCDGKVDEEANNPCGGPCTSVWVHQPGTTCSNGLLGACERPGRFVCKGTTDVTCDAPAPSGSAELCSDEVDNDCDGFVDEADAVDAYPWYQDCDSDGYAASVASSVRGCATPPSVGKCAWTNVLPSPSTKTNWDCNDASPSYVPGNDTFNVKPEGSSSFDFNCDGVAEKSALIFWYPRCAAGEVPSATNACAHWLDASGKRTNTQPACGESRLAVRWESGGLFQFEVAQACR